MLYYPQHNYLTQMRNNNYKTYLCTVIFEDGSNAIQVEIEAQNPPQAQMFAEARYGGNCVAANGVY